ncbi:MAG: heme utilization cystosolic carrier protein HutX [Oleiphilaceae bacterium]|nr:heme utilization cystosolic carrier protein HutX [Oleiphilaceae bacterium]
MGISDSHSALPGDALSDDFLSGQQAEALMRALSTWGKLTTIVLHGGCVFEFKGGFPPGSVAEGYYNLKGAQGFEGHIRLERIARVRFQDRPHRGRASYAFVFEDEAGASLFKVFLGRDEQGEVLADQLAAYERIRASLRIDA